MTYAARCPSRRSVPTSSSPRAACRSYTERQNATPARVVQVAHPAGVVVAGQVHGLDLVAQPRQPGRLALELDRLGQRVLPDPLPGPVEAAADAGAERHLVPA